jgi:hypothetical protein
MKAYITKTSEQILYILKNRNCTNIRCDDCFLKPPVFNRCSANFNEKEMIIKAQARIDELSPEELLEL